jgi:isocitrate lyase
MRQTPEQRLQERWIQDPRWTGIERPYSAKDVIRLRGTVQIEYTLACLGSLRLWDMLHTESYVKALGAMTGNQAVQQVLAGLKAVYLSGWQVVVKEINNAFLRADQMHHAEGKNGTYWFAPIVADAEAGFGGSLNAFELMKSMIEAGAAAVHFEDQLASAKKCGHMGGKVLVPAQEFVQKLVAARLAADIQGVPTILIARTDANGAKLLTSDSDLRDVEFLTGERTPEGYLGFKGGIDAAIARGLIYAPYADMIWCETSEPNVEEARRFAEAIHEKFPGKLLAYNCSPSFHWKKKLDEAAIAKFQTELAAMGYKFQFVTLAGFHALNYSMFELAHGYAREGMTAYSRLQEREFKSAEKGYTAVRHQRFVGTGYFDEVAQTIASGQSSTTAMHGSTETEQFVEPAAAQVLKPAA